MGYVGSKVPDWVRTTSKKGSGCKGKEFEFETLVLYYTILVR